MTVWVIRDGQLVEKGRYNKIVIAADFPTPMVSRMEPYESPVTGREVTSWRQRDQEMRDHNCYDGRDLPKDHVYSRGIDAQMKELSDARERQPDDAIWRDPTDDT
jgi:hypothetical protein